MGGHGRPHPWERYEIPDGRIEGSGCCQSPNRHDCSDTITVNILRAYTDSSYHPQTIANASRDFSTRKLSNEAGFRETTVIPMHCISLIPRRTGFVTEEESKACWIRRLLPVHIASLHYCHTQIGFGQRNGEGSHIAGAIDKQIVRFDDISRWNAMCVPISLLVSIFRISVTTLWNMIDFQCICKGHTGHAKVLNSKSNW